MEHETQSEKAHANFFSQLNPKAAFWFGVVSATAVFCILGLLIVLPFALRADKGSAKTAKANTNTAAVANTNTAPAKISFRPVSNDDHLRGDKNAKVTVIEYSDLECPFCKTVHPTMQKLMTDYSGKIQWVYRHYPLVQLHSQAPKEANAAECASEQGKFWEFIDLVFERTPSNDGLDLAKLPDYAEELKMNKKKFTDCLSADKYDSVVQGDATDATNAGARGTPYFLVVDAKGNTTPINGALPYAQFQQAVDAALKT